MTTAAHDDPAGEHLDVVIVGAGLSGIGAAYRLQTSAPARATPSSRRATRSAAPGTCSATPASARTRTCSPSATRSGRGARPKSIADGATIRDYIASTAAEARHRAAHPLPHQGRRRLLVLARTPGGAADARRRRTATPRTVTCCVPLRLRRLLRLRPRPPARLPRHEDFAGAGSCTPSAGPRTSTTPASRSSSSAAARPRSPSSRRMAERAAHVTMLQRTPHLIGAAGAGPARRPAARAAAARSSPTSVIRAKNVAVTPGVLPVLPAPPEQPPGGAAAGAAKQLGDALRSRPSTSARRTTRGTSGSALTPDGDLFRADPEGQAEVVTDPSTASSARASGCAPGGPSRPTSSSPPRACRCCRSAACPSPSTASRSTSASGSPTAG